MAVTLTSIPQHESIEEYHLNAFEHEISLLYIFFFSMPASFLLLYKYFLSPNIYSSQNRLTKAQTSTDEAKKWKKHEKAETPNKWKKHEKAEISKKWKTRE